MLRKLKTATLRVGVYNCAIGLRQGTTNLQSLSLVQPHVLQEQTIDHDQGEQKATNVDAGCPILTMRNDVGVVFNIITFVVLDYYICGVVVIDSLPLSSLGSGSCPQFICMLALLA